MSAYFVFHHRVTDPDKLNVDYLPKALESFAPFDMEVLAVDPEYRLVEGRSAYDRMVILKFASRDEAERWYNSPEYQAIVHLRMEAVDGIAALCDGWTG